ncbi:MFS transporter [Bradyrhizobium sp. 14AA]
MLTIAKTAGQEPTADDRASTNENKSIESALDNNRVGRFHVWLLFLSFVGMVVDGYDLTVAGFATPSLVKAWNIAPSMIGVILSMSLAGVLIGSFAFGWIGDRYGRKPALIWANVLLGIATFSTVAASGPLEFAALRGLAGLGIGGVIPNLVALVSEFAPSRVRAREVMRMLLGSAVGAGAPGLVSIFLLPTWGWQAFFVVGGVTPLMIGLIYALYLPESVKFLMVSKPSDPRIAKTLERLGVNHAISVEVPTGEKVEGGLAQLFAGRMRVVTPLLWVAFIADLMVYYFIFGWTPLLLGAAGAAPDKAALATTMFSLGGALSGIVLGTPVDRLGPRILPLLFLAAMALVVPIGALATSSFLNYVAFGAGFALLGLQYALNAIAGGLYPTQCRSQGVGSALGVGRIGAIAGSLGGGVLVSAGLSVSTIYGIVVGPLMVAVLACSLIVWQLRNSKS